MRSVKGMLCWLTKNWGQMDNNYAWANIEKKLDCKEIDRIVAYCKKKGNVDFSIVISGINPLRPERTTASLPEWLRSNTIFNSLWYDMNNSFVFISCAKDEEDSKRELIDFVSNILYPEVKKCELAVYYYK